MSQYDVPFLPVELSTPIRPPKLAPLPPETCPAEYDSIVLASPAYPDCSPTNPPALPYGPALTFPKAYDSVIAPTLKPVIPPALAWRPPVTAPVAKEFST